MNDTTTDTPLEIITSCLSTLDEEISDAYAAIEAAENPSEASYARRALDEIRNPDDARIVRTVHIPVAIGGPGVRIEVLIGSDGEATAMTWHGTFGTSTHRGMIADGSATWCWARDMAEALILTDQAPF